MSTIIRGASSGARPFLHVIQFRELYHVRHIHVLFRMAFAARELVVHCVELLVVIDCCVLVILTVLRCKELHMIQGRWRMTLPDNAVASRATNDIYLIHDNNRN